MLKMKHHCVFKIGLDFIRLFEQKKATLISAQPEMLVLDVPITTFTRVVSL